MAKSKGLANAFKLRGLVDLRGDGGCVGDGVTDDTAGAQAAVDLAIALGTRTVVAHGGTYLLSSAITCPSAVSFVFTGGATLKAKAGFLPTVADDGNPHNIMVYVTGPGVSFDGVVFEFNDLVDLVNGFVGIWATGTGDRCNVNNCEFYNLALSAGIMTTAILFRSGADYSRVESCLFKECVAGAQTQGGQAVVFHDNTYYARTPTVGAYDNDTAFGLDGGVGCQATLNRIIFHSSARPGGSVIGVTSGSRDFLVADNTILGQRGGVGIYVWDGAVAFCSYGIIARNLLDMETVAATGTYNAIKVQPTSHNIQILDNKLVRAATGAASSIGIDIGANNIVIQGNHIDMGVVQAAIAWRPANPVGGTLDIIDNAIATPSKCCYMIDPATNGGGITWIKNNTFTDAARAVDVVGATEANSPVYMKDNSFIGASFVNGVIGTRWDPAFTPGVGGYAGQFPHLCSVRTILQSAGVPDATWQTGGGSFSDGDQVWNNAPVALNSPGWICTTPGTAGGTAVFSAMPNLI